MKTDKQLQKDVMDEIKWEPCVTATQIGVSAANGVVTLTGTVATYAEKWAVERAAQRVEGVKGIAEEITVKLSGHARPDRRRDRRGGRPLPQVARLGADRHPGHRGRRAGSRSRAR